MEVLCRHNYLFRLQTKTCVNLVVYSPHQGVKLVLVLHMGRVDLAWCWLITVMISSRKWLIPGLGADPCTIQIELSSTNFKPLNFEKLHICVQIREMRQTRATTNLSRLASIAQSLDDQWKLALLVHMHSGISDFLFLHGLHFMSSSDERSVLENVNSRLVQNYI